VLRKEEYVSKSKVKTKEDLKAVAETGFSLTLRNSSADLQVKNPPPYSYQSLHNPDCCCQQAFGFLIIDLLSKK
jgi:hypothetical protein